MDLRLSIAVLFLFNLGLCCVAELIKIEDFESCGNGQVFGGEIACFLTWVTSSPAIDVEVRFTGLGNHQLSQTDSSSVGTTISTKGFQNVQMTVNIVPPGTNDVFDFCVAQVVIGPGQARQTQSLDGTEPVVQGQYSLIINPGDLDDNDNLFVSMIAGKNSNSPFFFECLFDNVQFTGDRIPTSSPSEQPTTQPTTLSPTFSTETPTAPTDAPTEQPTEIPTTSTPTEIPTRAPSEATNAPTALPTPFSAANSQRNLGLGKWVLYAVIFLGMQYVV